MAAFSVLGIRPLAPQAAAAKRPCRPGLLKWCSTHFYVPWELSMALVVESLCRLTLLSACFCDVETNFFLSYKFTSRPLKRHKFRNFLRWNPL